MLTRNKQTSKMSKRDIGQEILEGIPHRTGISIAKLKITIT
jgi:hypothetical protein